MHQECVMSKQSIVKCFVGKVSVSSLCVMYVSQVSGSRNVTFIKDIITVSCYYN